MDVSALNLGMIAAYYNISCKYYSRSYIDNFQHCCFQMLLSRSTRYHSRSERSSRASWRLFLRLPNSRLFPFGDTKMPSFVASMTAFPSSWIRPISKHHTSKRSSFSKPTSLDSNYLQILLRIRSSCSKRSSICYRLA